MARYPAFGIPHNIPRSIPRRRSGAFCAAFRGAFRKAPPSPFRAILHALSPPPLSSPFSSTPGVPPSPSSLAAWGVASPVLGNFEGFSPCLQREIFRSRSVANRVSFSSAIKRVRQSSTHPRRRQALSAGASTSSCRRLSSVSSCSCAVVGASSGVSWSEEAYAPTISAGV